MRGFPTSMSFQVGFRGADLTEANFSAANLQDADLSRAVLTGANLDETDFAAPASREPIWSKPVLERVWKLRSCV